MTGKELALRIALVALIKEFERLCDVSNRTPERNQAYRDAVSLMEAEDAQL